MNAYETPAQEIVRLADERKLSEAALDNLFEALLVGDPIDLSDPLAALINDSFSGDDSYDELRHEVDHVTGACDDLDPDCIWYDEDDED